MLPLASLPLKVVWPAVAVYWYGVAAEPAASAKLNVPEPFVVKTWSALPSAVGYVKPATSNPVPLSNCNSVLVNLAPILFEPAFLNANSIKPSSVVSEASEIFPVIFA